MDLGRSRSSWKSAPPVRTSLFRSIGFLGLFACCVTAQGQLLDSLAIFSQARPKFIAKAELGRIPLFGRASRACGMIFIDRDNRKAAFAGYETAARRIRGGASIVVFPEGTRGHQYALRPFKKGPFVLAVASGAPIVPTVLHGTREVFGRGTMWVRSGEVHVHFLEPISTEGLTYDDRDQLSRQASQQMSEALQREYGVQPATKHSGEPLEAASA